MLSVIHQTSLLTESILSLKKIETVHRLHPSLLYESLDGLFSAVIPQPSWKPKQFIWVNCSVGSCGSCNSHRSCEPTSLNQNSEWNRSAKSLVAASQGVSELFRILLIICRSMAFFRLNEFSLFKKATGKYYPLSIVVCVLHSVWLEDKQARTDNAFRVVSKRELQS